MSTDAIAIVISILVPSVGGLLWAVFWGGRLLQEMKQVKSAVRQLSSENHGLKESLSNVVLEIRDLSHRVKTVEAKVA